MTVFTFIHKRNLYGLRDTTTKHIEGQRIGRQKKNKRKFKKVTRFMKFKKEKLFGRNVFFINTRSMKVV